MNILDSIKKTIIENKLISSGDVIGVALSGGQDSMALLHYLSTLQEELDFEVVGIHVDHSIRPESGDDARFVVDYCRKNGIRAYKFRVDAPRVAKEKNISMELAAREVRYGVFEAVIQKGIVGKIAIAHHMSDQAETILLRLFRGSGVSGAKGMCVTRGENYIRPMLNTEKKEINKYILDNDIPFVQDETNFDDEISRNYLRNKVIPMIEKKWPGVVGALVSFGKSCADDDEFINSQVYDDALIISDKSVQIPCSYFVFHPSIVSRLVFRALKKIGVEQDVERKHIELIINLAKNGENGKKINLPFDLTAHKEYDYLTIINKFVPKRIGSWPFKTGEFEIDGFGTIVTKRTKDFSKKDNELLLDWRKVPENAKWRFREDGDVFEKFGGGTKKLKSFLIDKKVPQRLRELIPVLADENGKVYAIAGIEISDSVKVDENTLTAYKISVNK